MQSRPPNNSSRPKFKTQTSELKPELFFDQNFLHLNLRRRAISAVGLRRGDCVDYVLTFSYATEDRVARRQRIIDMHDEKLRSVCVWTSIRHRYRTGFVAALINFR